MPNDNLAKDFQRCCQFLSDSNKDRRLFLLLLFFA
uniref:Bm523 n=1 Tax=Brugia malayi TaxID=6279 RepID=A0A0J9XXA6_BRUMA|nr:Bm523 [Brugia malayi]